nr:hypothetical protein [Rhizobium jaguaris]
MAGPTFSLRFFKCPDAQLGDLLLQAGELTMGMMLSSPMVLIVI